MPDVLVQIVEKVGAIAAAVAGALLAIDKTRNALMRLSSTKPMLRKSIKADLELFNLMKKTDPGYTELKAHIKNQVLMMLQEGKKKELVRGNSAQMLVGLTMAGGFSYLSYHIITSQTISNWFLILTIWMALAGIGFLTSASRKSGVGQNSAARVPAPHADLQISTGKE